MPNDTPQAVAGQTAREVPGERLDGPSAGRLGGSLVTGTLWSMLGIAALGLTRLAYTTLVGRTGSPERLAQVNAQISLAFVATFVTAAATGAAASKFLPLTAARDGSGAAAVVRRRLTLWTRVGTLGVLVVLLVGGRWFLPDASFPELLGVMALTAAYGSYTFGKSVLYGYHRAGRYAVLEVLSDIATLVLTGAAVVVTSVLSTGDWQNALVIVPLVLGYAGFAVAASRSVPSTPRGDRPDATAGPGRTDGRTGPDELGRELTGFVAYTALGIVASQGFFQVSMLVAGHTTTGAQAGVYAAAMSLVTPAFFLPRAMALAFFPAAAEAVGAGDRGLLAHRTSSLTRMLVLTMLPVFAVGAMVGGPVMHLLYGSRYAGGGAVIAVLLAAVFLYVVAVPSVNALSAYELDDARIPPLASAVGVLVGIAAWFALGDRLGGLGIAIGYFAGLVVQAGTPLVVAARRLRLGTPFTVPTIALGVLGGALAVVSVVRPEPFVVAGCVLAFLLVYAWSRRRDLAQLVALARRGRPALRR